MVIKRAGFFVVAAALWAAAPGAPERAAIKKALYVSDPLPPLAAEAHGRFEPEPGIVVERITYGTQYGMRVPAILYMPKARRGRIPAFIVVNGHGGDKYSWYPMYTGMLYARAGAAVLTYDPVGEGERNAQRKSGTRAHDRDVDPPEMARRMGGLMQTDLAQAVSYLASRPEVDSRRIAAGGYSMGSFVLSIGCAIETRLRACVLVGGGNLDEAGGYWDKSKKMCQGIPYQSLQFLGDRAAAIYALQADHAATLVFNGASDTVVSIPTKGKPEFFTDLRNRVIKLRGNQKNVFTFAYEPGTASHRPYWVTRPVGDWLHRQLHFARWPPEGETRILEWSQKNNVAMDKGYISLDREGGTMAAGTGVPALTREQLTVLPPEEWEKQKSRFVYESWIEQTRARIVIH